MSWVESGCQLAARGEPRCNAPLPPQARLGIWRLVAPKRAPALPSSVQRGMDGGLDASISDHTPAGKERPVVPAELGQWGAPRRSPALSIFTPSPAWLEATLAHPKPPRGATGSVRLAQQHTRCGSFRHLRSVPAIIRNTELALERRRCVLEAPATVRYHGQHPVPSCLLTAASSSPAPWLPRKGSTPAGGTGSSGHPKNPLLARPAPHGTALLVTAPPKAPDWQLREILAAE